MEEETQLESRKKTKLRKNRTKDALPPLKRKWYRHWIWPMLWFFPRLLIIPALFVGTIYGGLWFGYHKLGGKPAADIEKLDTWMHVYNLVYQTEPEGVEKKQTLQKLNNTELPTKAPISKTTTAPKTEGWSRDN